MPEPTSSTVAVATFVAASSTIPALTAFGVPLGLRADLLIAGFAGSLVAIVLLNTVPSTGDTWRDLLRATTRRMAVAVASSLTAGYLTPMVMLAVALPDPLIMGSAFAVGVGAQKILISTLARINGAAPQRGGDQA